MEVIDFDSQVAILQAFTSDQSPRSRRRSARRRSTARPSLYNAIYISLKELKKASAPPTPTRSAAQAIVVLSDGDDTSSLVGVRRGARPGEAVGDGDLRDRAASRTTAAAATSRRRSSCCEQLVAGNRRPRVLPGQRRRAAEDLRADLRGAGQPVRDRLHVEEPGAQRRLAPASSSGVERPDMIGRTRQGYYAPDRARGSRPCTCIPLVLYAAPPAPIVAHFARRDPQHRPRWRPRCSAPACSRTRS